jgi:hypothetical protein
VQGVTLFAGITKGAMGCHKGSLVPPKARASAAGAGSFENLRGDGRSCRTEANRRARSW